MAGEVLLDSVVRVTWDPDGVAKVLVEIGDPMWEPVAIDGRQEIQIGNFVRRKGAKVYPRQKETHDLRWMRCEITPTIQDAFQERIAATLDLPRGQADVLISFASGQSYRLKNASVVAWPADQHGRLTRQTVEIKGGEIEEDGTAGPPPIGLDDAAINLSRASGMLNAAGNAAIHKEAIATWENSGTGDDGTQTTAGNRPKLLVGPALYLPGITWNWYGSSAVSPTSQFAVRWAGWLPSYTPAARVCLVGKWAQSLNQRTWALFLEPTGQITLAISTDGTAATVTEWTSAFPVAMPPNAFIALEVVRGPVQVNFRLYPTLEYVNGIDFAPPINTAPITPYASLADLLIGSSDSSNQDLGEMRVGLVRYAPNINAPGYMEFNFVENTFTGIGSLTTQQSGVDPMVTMGRSGNYAARFDGTNDNFVVAAPAALNAVPGVSIFIYGRIHRTTGINDLLFLGSNDADLRILLRIDNDVLKLIVRRLDGEATVEATAVVGAGMTQISASIDYVAGTATLYTLRAPRDVVNLTSAGLSSATDSSETRIMAGQGGSNPANADLWALHVVERATNIFEHDALWESIIAANA